MVEKKMLYVTLITYYVPEHYAIINELIFVVSHFAYGIALTLGPRWIFRSLA